MPSHWLEGPPIEVTDVAGGAYRRKMKVTVEALSKKSKEAFLQSDR
jgi:hypothetical protein